MTDREQFEKVWLVSKNIYWNGDHYSGMTSHPNDALEAQIQNARWEAWRSRKADPWDMAPKTPTVRHPEVKMRLFVLETGKWNITLFTNMRYAQEVASGYNCDPSRNGETKTWNENGGWE